MVRCSIGFNLQDIDKEVCKDICFKHFFLSLFTNIIESRRYFDFWKIFVLASNIQVLGIQIPWDWAAFPWGPPGLWLAPAWPGACQSRPSQSLTWDWRGRPCLPCRTASSKSSHRKLPGQRTEGGQSTLLSYLMDQSIRGEEEFFKSSKFMKELLVWSIKVRL